MHFYMLLYELRMAIDKKYIHLCNCVCIFTCFYSKFNLICNFYEGFLKGRRATTHFLRVAQLDGKWRQSVTCHREGANYAVNMQSGAKVASRAAGVAQLGGIWRQSVNKAILKTRLEPLMIGIIFGEYVKM